MLRNWIGAAFFLFAAVLAGMAAWERPSILPVMNTVHNALLAFLYATRLPAHRSDRTGLVLGLTAALLPILGGIAPTEISPTWTLTGIGGELLALWSLVTLGRRFGIAPADRGLVVSGPYGLIRHPMYTGELLLRLALTSGSGTAFVVMPLMLALQVLRAFREEKMIAGYEDYSTHVPWRFLPGIF
jgi:protein-S-isoprenylcysteine O-methyltransferase Ste14